LFTQRAVIARISNSLRQQQVRLHSPRRGRNGSPYGGDNNNVFFHQKMVLSKSGAPAFDKRAKWDVEFKLVQQRDGRTAGYAVSGPNGKKFP